MTYTHTCVVCDTPFNSRSHRSKYCSHACYLKYIKQHRLENIDHQRKLQRANRDKHRERTNRRERERRAANPEKVREEERIQRAKNPERSRRKNNAWRARNREHILARERVWRNENPEKCAARRRKRYDTKREQIIAQSSERYYNNRELELKKLEILGDIVKQAKIQGNKHLKISIARRLLRDFSINITSLAKEQLT